MAQPRDKPHPYADENKKEKVGRALMALVDFIKKDEDNFVLKRFDRLSLYSMLALHLELGDCTKEIAEAEREAAEAAADPSLYDRKIALLKLMGVIEKARPLLKSYSECSG